MSGKICQAISISPIAILSLLSIFSPIPTPTWGLSSSSAVIPSHHPQENTFDFIIAGGGTAGLVLARRLSQSQNKRFTVLVLESGDEPQPGTDIPANARFNVVNPDRNVSILYNSIPQRNAALGNNGIITVLTGRVLSGTSNLNSMVFNRGSPRGYAHWANVTHDPTWNYSNMLKYFKRAETYRGEYPSDQHGFSGPLTISQPSYAPGLRKYWLEAGRFLGYEIADPNGPQKISFAAAEFTKRRGRRVNSLSGYVTPIRTSSLNLFIATNTNATKIVFRKRQAIGVRFQTASPLLRNFHDNCVYARKEIILSSGTFGSALLLLRSGVGPKDDLREANIPVIKNLSVGLNFQDHVQVRLPIVINNPFVVLDEDRDLNPHNFELYKAFGDGPFASISGVTGQAFAASSVAKSEGEGDWADLQLVMQHVKQNNGNPLVRNDTLGSWEVLMSASIFVTRPKSKGSLKLDPNGPDGPPILDPGYLTDPRDMKAMLDGIAKLLSIFEETPAYQSIGARFPRDINLPGCAGLRFRSRKWWECYVRYNSRTGNHPAGSCKMGRRGSPDAVVDSELRVIGIDGLRVVDASIMPVLTNANTQAPVYGIAEKASDMILRDYSEYLYN